MPACLPHCPTAAHPSFLRALSPLPPTPPPPLLSTQACLDTACLRDLVSLVATGPLSVALPPDLPHPPPSVPQACLDTACLRDLVSLVVTGPLSVALETLTGGKRPQLSAITVSALDVRHRRLFLAFTF